MRNGEASTAHYRAVIADLRAERARLFNQTELARAALVSKEQCLADLDKTIAQLEHRAGPDDYERPVGEAPLVAFVPASQETFEQLKGLGLGDACVAAIRALGGRATNQQITTYLAANGYEIKSSNPVNNVGTGLNHRRRARGDVVREGRDWVLQKSESPATNGASLINGAAVAPA